MRPLLEPKTDRSRRTVMLADVVALRAHRTRQRMERLVSDSRWVDSGHLFTTMHGTPYHAATITRAFQAALARAGLPHCRFHDLRHPAATFLLAQGMTSSDHLSWPRAGGGAPGHGAPDWTSCRAHATEVYSEGAAIRGGASAKNDHMSSVAEMSSVEAPPAGSLTPPGQV